MLLIGRMPAAVSRRCIQTALGPTRTPEMTVLVKRPQRSPSISSTGAVRGAPAYSITGAGRRSSMPSRAATSRATPT